MCFHLFCLAVHRAFLQVLVWNPKILSGVCDCSICFTLWTYVITQGSSSVCYCLNVKQVSTEQQHNIFSAESFPGLLNTSAVHAVQSDSTAGYKDIKTEPVGGRTWSKLGLTVDKSGLRIYDNGSNVNKLFFSYSSVATGLPVRTETITMTDMNQSGLLIAPRCMLGTKQAMRRVKPGPGDLPGKTNYHWWEKAEFLPLSTPHFYDHIISSPPWATAVMGEQQFFSADLVVGTVRRCIFTLWSLAREKSAPWLLMLWRLSQLVWKR